MTPRGGRILVTGANGFVGGALCVQAAARGWRVRGATRGECQMAAVENIAVGMIDAETDWTPALQGVDVVIHLAARVHVMHDAAVDPLAAFRDFNLHGTMNFARQAARAGVRRFVFVSSIKVNGEQRSSGRAFTESDQADPQDPYAVSKWEAEQALQRMADETGMEVVIVRPPLVYGPGVKGNFAQMLKVLAKRIPLPLASVHNLRSLVYIGNLADALIACAAHPAAAGQTYLVSDGEDLSTPSLLRQLGVAMGRPALLLPCPPGLLRLAARVTGKADQMQRLQGSLQVDSGKIRRELGWTPPYTLQQGLQETAEWYRNTHL